jgi:pimeloyl-ACP methyl ester carboxylesterase
MAFLTVAGGRLEYDCGHSPHRDQPEAVLAAITRFVARIAR